MAHVFISYSSNALSLTEDLAKFLEGCGLEVWWDRELASRGPFDDQIKKQLRAAGAIVVLWTEGALVSEWVKIEADYALAHDKLVNVRSDDISPKILPPPFDTIDAHKLSELDLILRDVLAVREGRLLLRDLCETLPPPSARPLSALLQSRFRIVGYVDGNRQLADCLNWALNRGSYALTPRRSAARLIYGSGGSGKTRMMIEAADELRAVGWSAGFLTRSDPDMNFDQRQRRAKAVQHLIDGARDEGLLIILDYAESRETEIQLLCERIYSLAASSLRPIRLVLLVRAPGEWWRRLYDGTPSIHALFQRNDQEADVFEASSTSTDQHRMDLFVKAVHGFAPALIEQNYVLPSGEPEQVGRRVIGDGEGYELPLAIAIEALLWLLNRSAATGQSVISSLLDAVVGEEQVHWTKLLGNLAADSRRDPALDLRRGVAQATLVQGLASASDAERLFRADPYYGEARDSRASVREVLENIARLYGRPNDAIGALEPDLLGEHFISAEADTDIIDGCTAWTVAVESESRAWWRYNLLTILQRASHPIHGPVRAAKASALIDHLLGQHVAAYASVLASVCVDSQGVLLDRLWALLPQFSAPSVSIINSFLPIRSVQLQAFSLAVADRHYTFTVAAANITPPPDDAVPDATNSDVRDAQWRQRVHDVALRPTHLQMLSQRLAAAGYHAEAVEHSQQAIDAFRRIADPARLDTMSKGQLIAEVFIATTQIAYGSVLLAEMLNQHSVNLANVGRHEDALQASLEVVNLYRETYPDKTNLTLADSLGNLSNRYRSLGRHEEAMETAAVAIKMLRALVASHPDAAHKGSLANKLMNTGIVLSNQGQAEPALACFREARGLLSDLAAEQPDAYLPEYALCLNNISTALSPLARYEEAVVNIEQAVDAFRTLVKRSPDAFLPDLAMSLHNAATFLTFVGRYDHAIMSAREAVAIRTRLADKLPEVFLPLLAGSLANLARARSVSGKPFEALPIAHCAIATLATLARTHLVHHADLVAEAHKIYVTTCFQARVTPLADVLQKLERAMTPQVMVNGRHVEPELMETIKNIILDSRRAGKLDEERVAKIPPDLAHELRRLWKQSFKGQ